jgi:S-adenosylmethionine decarboxylase
VTALILLSESHIAVHTFPEVNVATVSVYCCRPRPSVDWDAAVARFFHAESALVQRIRRGGRSGSP